MLVQGDVSDLREQMARLDGQCKGSESAGDNMSDLKCEKCGWAVHATVQVEPERLRAYYRTSEDVAETERIKEYLAGIQQDRRPHVLLRIDELLCIARWKLRNQYGRTERHFSDLTNELVQAVSRAAFSLPVQDLSDEVQTRVQLRLLRSLPGVDIGIASAILALMMPGDYCAIDFRGWRALFSRERSQFTEGQYLQYRAGVRCLARQLGWSVQDTDLALWELGGRER